MGPAATGWKTNEQAQVDPWDESLTKDSLAAKAPGTDSSGTKTSWSRISVKEGLRKQSDTKDLQMINKEAMKVELKEDDVTRSGAPSVAWTQL